VTAETRDAKLASRRPKRYLYTETANDFNHCVLHTASVVTNFYASPVCALLVLYNAVLISTQGHVTAETHAAKLASRRPSRFLYTKTVNDFNKCVAHTASVVTNIYTSPVWAFLVLYNAAWTACRLWTDWDSLDGRQAISVSPEATGRPGYLGLYSPND